MEPYLIKKIALYSLQPLSLIMFLMGAAMVSLWFRKGRSLERGLVTAAFFGLVLAASSPWPGRALGLLEGKIPPMPDRGALERTYGVLADRARYVVVLGAGYIPNRALPESSCVPAPGVVRLVEGIRLHRMYPHTQLLVSGRDEASGMKALAVALGVEPEKVIEENDSRDTDDQARNISAIIKKEPAFLVSSAWHLPRATLNFQACGSTVIPVPTDHAVRWQSSPWQLTVPWAESVGVAERCMKEYLGLLWGWWKGWGTKKTVSEPVKEECSEQAVPAEGEASQAGVSSSASGGEAVPEKVLQSSETVVVVPESAGAAPETAGEPKGAVAEPEAEAAAP
jgi:uncharacterized SAM-binding protein YcdF (DUF218 family)